MSKTYSFDFLKKMKSLNLLKRKGASSQILDTIHPRHHVHNHFFWHFFHKYYNKNVVAVLQCITLMLQPGYTYIYMYIFFPVVKECVPFVFSVKAMSTPYQSHLSLNGHFCKLDIALRQRIPKFRKRVTYS